MSFCLITELSKSLTEPGSRLHFEMSHYSEGTIRVRCTPEIGAVPANACEEEVQIRIALSQPLTATGTPQEVAAGLESYLGQQRQLVEQGVASLSAMREKLNAAQVVASKSNPKPGQSAPQSSAETEQGEPVAGGTDDPDDQAPLLEYF